MRYPSARNSGDPGPQMVLWRIQDVRCEFWIENGRSTLRLYRNDHLVRCFQGTRALLCEQAERWRTAVATDPIRDPAPHDDPLLIWTDIAGRVLELSPPAAELLSVTGRAMLGRSVYLFIAGNRPSAMHAVERITFGRTDSETIDVVLQPRDRRPRRAVAHLQPSTHPHDRGPVVRWLLNAPER